VDISVNRAMKMMAAVTAQCDDSGKPLQVWVDGSNNVVNITVNGCDACEGGHPGEWGPGDGDGQWNGIVMEFVEGLSLGQVNKVFRDNEAVEVLLFQDPEAKKYTAVVYRKT
jgi:hypothetical protein